MAIDELAEIDGHKPKVFLNDGEEREAKSQTSNSTYKVKRTWDHYYCTCPAWRNQGGVPVNARSCKHLRELLGDDYEAARVLWKNPDGPPPKPASKKKAKAPASKGKGKKKADSGSEDDKPKSKKKPVVKGKGKRKAESDDEDEEEDDVKAKPKSKRAKMKEESDDEDEEDVKPKSKSKRAKKADTSDSEDEKPKSKKKSVSKRAKKDDDSDDSEDDKPKSKKKPVSKRAKKEEEDDSDSEDDKPKSKKKVTPKGNGKRKAESDESESEDDKPRKKAVSKGKGKRKAESDDEDDVKSKPRSKRAKVQDDDDDDDDEPAKKTTVSGIKSVPALLLANKWDIETGPDPTGWWISEKLDGVRTYYDGKGMVSRLGNPFTPPKWFLDKLPKDITLDGELFGGRGQFQDTVSIVKTQNSPHWKEITFQIFDIPSENAVFEERIALLKKLFGPGGKYECKEVVLLEHEKAKDRKHVLKKLKEIETLGGEGLMLRRAKSKYEGKRSGTLLKIKTFYDAEAEVTGYTDGKGKNVGVTGALKCKMESGKTFNVGTGLSDKLRRNPPKIGSIIVYRFQELTRDGVPRFPSYIGEAIDKTEAKDADIPAHRKTGTSKD